MPTQFTTASMSFSRGSHCAASTSVLKSQAIHSMSGWMRRASVKIAPRSDDADAVAPQRRDDRAADEAVGPGDEAAHAREPFRSTCSGGGYWLIPA